MAQTDFSQKATDVNTEIDPGARVVNPPDRSGEINALNQIGRGIGVGARTVAQYFQNNANNASAARMAKFKTDLLGLSDAEAQGVSPSEILIRSRTRLAQEYANNPNAEKDIGQAYSQWQTQTGYNKVATPAMQQEQVRQQQIQTAVSNGFLSANDINNPTKVQQAQDSLENYQHTVTTLGLQQKQIDAKLAQNNLSNSDRTRLQNEKEDNALDGLHAVAAASLPYWKTKFNDAMSQINSETDPTKREQLKKTLLIQMDQDFAQKTAELANGGLGTNQAKIDQVLNPIKGLLDVYKKQIDGTYDAQQAKSLIDNANAQIELQALRGLDAEGKALVGTSKLLGQSASVVLQGAGAAAATNLFSKMKKSMQPDANGDPSTDKSPDILTGGSTGETDTRSYFDRVKKMVGLAKNGKLDEESKTELNQQFAGILKSVSAHGSATDNAKQFQPVLDLLSDPSVGAYLAAGNQVPSDFGQKALQVMQDGYNAQVIPLIRDGMNKLFLGDIKMGAGGVGSVGLSGPAWKFAQPVFENGKFGFKIADGVQPSRDVTNLVNSLNTSNVTKVMNKMVMANAHMQQSTDYQKSFEQLAPQILGTFQDTQANGENANTTGQLPKKQNGSLDLMGWIRSVTNDFNSNLTGFENSMGANGTKDANGKNVALSDLEDAPIQANGFVPATENPDVDKSVMDSFAGKRIPVSIRNNNMGAISIEGDIASSWAAKQQGFVGTSRRPANEGGYYAVYATPEDGVAAASNLLQKYGRDGVDTPLAIVSKWSADKSAHSAYAGTLVKFLNRAGYDTDKNTQIDLSDPNVRLAVLKAKSAHESGAGKQVYSDAVFERGVLGRNG